MEKLVEIYVRMMVWMSAERKGQGVVEYVLILALISVVALTFMAAVGTDVTATFSKVADQIK